MLLDSCCRLAATVTSTGDHVDSAIAAAALAALGHSLRLQVWCTLLPHGSLGLCAGSIAAQVSVAPSSLSFHLQQMIHGRVLVQRRRSRQIIYAVNYEIMDALCKVLGGGDLIQPPSSALSVQQADDVFGDAEVRSGGESTPTNSIMRDTREYSS
jgi:ArsR family transcriptional regulator, arsenate/arsenite/antimonite-responsive transcriptional repressor